MEERHLLLTGSTQDHGGGIDAARTLYGGSRIAWVDLSTGINPCAYPVAGLRGDVWSALPDSNALAALLAAARRHWKVPEGADVLAAPGASAIIARVPTLAPPGQVIIPQPTYNEHAAAFAQSGWRVRPDGQGDAQVVVHPNNPDGRLWTSESLSHEAHALTVIDESFCDVAPDATLIARTSAPRTIVLKSFGKFWGLAGLRLGFAIGEPEQIAKLRESLGPWAVAGPALQIGTAALNDHDWAVATRARLSRDSARLDDLMLRHGAEPAGGTTLFRLYNVDSAAEWQKRLARHRIWSRIFPYNTRWLRLGLPHPLHWPRLEAALLT